MDSGAASAKGMDGGWGMVVRAAALSREFQSGAFGESRMVSGEVFGLRRSGGAVAARRGAGDRFGLSGGQLR